MPIRNSNGLRWPAALLCTALIIYGSAFVLVRWYDSRALTLPIDLKPGTTRSPEFHVDQKVNYLVELEVERNIPFNELNCLLGQPPIPNSMPRQISR